MEHYADTHGGHRDRLRAKVQENGMDNMADHEIIEFLLYYVIPRQDVNALAHALTEHFGSAQAVLQAPLADLVKVDGVGRRTAQWLALVGEAMNECALLRIEDRIPIRSLMQLLRYGCRLRREIVPPCSMQICLDTNERLIFQRRLTDSRAWGEPEYLRQALSDVLQCHAAKAIILQFAGPLHAEPENYDIRRAAAYADTLHLAGSALLDVVIIGEGGICSMRQEGLIPSFSREDRLTSLREDYLRGVPDLSAMGMDEIEKELAEEAGESPAGAARELFSQRSIQEDGI